LYWEAATGTLAHTAQDRTGKSRAMYDPGRCVMDRTTHRIQVVLLVLLALLVAGPSSMAQEVGDPRDAVTTITDAAGQATGGGDAPGGTIADGPAAAPSAPTEDDDAGAHETSDPEEPDHASGAVVSVDVAGEDAIDVGSTNAQVEDDGRSSGDVTVLAIGGNEIVGAHSDSRSGPENDTVAPLDALCEGSGGGVCVGLLFADTTSTESQGSSSAESDAALALACIGGTQTDSDAACDGQVGAGVATSNSEVTQDNETGDTTADQKTAVADACVGGEDAEGVCSGLGAEVMSAQSHSEAPSEDGPGTTSSSSCTADIQAGGSGNCVIEDSEALELPPGCPAGQSLLCLYVNQGEAFVFTGGAGSHQEAVHISVLGGAIEGSDLVTVHFADAETLATNAGPADVGDRGTGSGGPAPDVSAGGAGLPPELAFTGLQPLGLLAVVLLLAGAGAAMLALDRRRATVVR
jgi:hypothetical protein